MILFLKICFAFPFCFSLLKWHLKNEKYRHIPSTSFVPSLVLLCFGCNILTHTANQLAILVPLRLDCVSCFCMLKLSTDLLGWLYRKQDIWCTMMLPYDLSTFTTIIIIPYDSPVPVLLSLWCSSVKWRFRSSSLRDTKGHFRQRKTSGSSSAAAGLSTWTMTGWRSESTGLTGFEGDPAIASTLKSSTSW